MPLIRSPVTILLRSIDRSKGVEPERAFVFVFVFVGCVSCDFDLNRISRMIDCFPVSFTRTVRAVRECSADAERRCKRNGKKDIME